MKKIHAMVGGCCGFRTTSSFTKVTLDKKQYFFGETVKVMIDCDNSVCKEDVKKFRLKLLRRIWGKDTG